MKPFLFNEHNQAHIVQLAVEVLPAFQAAERQQSVSEGWTSRGAFFGKLQIITLNTENICLKSIIKWGNLCSQDGIGGGKLLGVVH